MMKELFTFPAEELKNTKEKAVVTLTMDIEEAPFDDEKDKIQFDNLIKEAKERVIHDVGEDVWNEIYAQVSDLNAQTDFWRKRNGGIVFYITPSACYYYMLSEGIGKSVFVSKQPNILPLVRDFQFNKHYHVLALTNEDFKLFNGKQFTIDEIELPEDAPNTLEKALGTVKTGGELNVGSYGGAGGGTGMFHGHNETRKEKEIDQTNYFRIVDEYVYEHYSKDMQLPVVLFTLLENEAIFRKISSNQFLSDVAIKKSPAQLSNLEIQKETIKAIKTLTEQRLTKLVTKFNETVPALRLESQYDDLAQASLEGRIDYLLIEEGTVVKGIINEDGQYESNPRNDYLNQLAWNVLNTHGEVYVLNRSEMPSSEKIMAGLRY